jgi:hypothetical protein
MADFPDIIQQLVSFRIESGEHYAYLQDGWLHHGTCPVGELEDVLRELRLFNKTLDTQIISHAPHYTPSKLDSFCDFLNNDGRLKRAVELNR